MNSTSKFDIWLVRGSHFAQIGLLCITVFTIFYTVIPLYQNAALQESVAKKEKELKELQNSIDALYVKHRNELLSNFIRTGVYDCSPLTNIIMKPSDDLYSNKKSFEEEMKEYRAIFDKDLNVCLKDMLHTNKYVRELRENDKVLLAQSINSLQPKIDAEKNKFIEIFNDREQLEKIGSVKSQATKDFDNFVNGLGMNIEGHEKMIQESYTLIGAMQVVSDYGFAFNKIVSDNIDIKSNKHPAK